MSVDKVGKLQRNKRQRVTRLGKDGLAPAAARVSLGDMPLGQSSRSSKDRHRPLPLIRGPGAVTETEAQGGRTRRLPGPGGGPRELLLGCRLRVTAWNGSGGCTRMHVRTLTCTLKWSQWSSCRFSKNHNKRETCTECPAGGDGHMSGGHSTPAAPADARRPKQPILRGPASTSTARADAEAPVLWPPDAKK